MTGVKNLWVKLLPLLDYCPLVTMEGYLSFAGDEFFMLPNAQHTRR